MHTMHFVLGAQDPEMKRIEEILTTRGISFIHATVSGKRVHPGNAYGADPVELPIGATPVWVECRPREAAGGIVIDHHRAGDPGFGLPAAQYWEASSIGQLYTLIQLGAPTHEDRVLAAMDHCFTAALHNECPYVTTKQVLALKCREIAIGTHTTPYEVAVEIGGFQMFLHTAPTVTIGTQDLKDLRSIYAGEGYSLPLLAAQVAAALSHVGVILCHRDFEGGPEKWSLSGHIAPSTVTTFLEDWAPAHRLEKIYGVPDRGYAGGYRAA